MIAAYFCPKHSKKSAHNRKEEEEKSEEKKREERRGIVWSRIRLLLHWYVFIHTNTEMDKNTLYVHVDTENPFNTGY